MGRSVGRYRLGALLHRPHPSRSLSLDRSPRRELGRPETTGGQLGAALDQIRAQRPGVDDASRRKLLQEGRRDHWGDGDHRAAHRGRPRGGPRRPQRQDRRAHHGGEQSRRGGDRRLQLEPRHGARVLSRSAQRQGTGWIRTRLDGKRTYARSPGGWPSDAHGPYLVLRLRHPGLPRSGTAPRPRLPHGAGLHLGQSAGPSLSQRGAFRRQYRHSRTDGADAAPCLGDHGCADDRDHGDRGSLLPQRRQGRRGRR